MATGKDIAWCGRMDYERRCAWVKAGLLKRDPPLAEHDAIETAIARALADGTNSQRARRAFAALQEDLRSQLLAGVSDLWAVVPVDGHGFQLAGSASSAALSLAAMREPGFIVSLKDPIEQARRRYAQVLANQPSGGAKVHDLRARTRETEAASDAAG